MKIPSEYSQHSIISRTNPAVSTGKIQAARAAQGKGIQKPAVSSAPDPAVRVSFSEAAERILSSGEKLMIATQFSQEKNRVATAYQANGKTVNMEVMIGRKIDVKG